MKNGFTLIELLVSISIFSIFIIAAFSLFSSAFKYQERNLNSAYLLNNASFFTEYMSRALRMAKKDISGTCTQHAGWNFAISTEEDHIKFLNSDGECQEFFLGGTILKVGKSGSYQDLTPSDIIVEGLKFKVQGEEQTDQIQPKVTFRLVLKTTGQSPQKLNLQTTISQRDLDIQKGI